MTRLFDDKWDNYTEVGNTYALLANQALRPIVKRAADEGVSLRDLHYILTTEVTSLAAELTIRRNMETRQKEKAEKAAVQDE